VSVTHKAANAIPLGLLGTYIFMSFSVSEGNRPLALLVF
jgi:hypothetical protein